MVENKSQLIQGKGGEKKCIQTAVGMRKKERGPLQVIKDKLQKEREEGGANHK